MIWLDGCRLRRDLGCPRGTLRLDRGKLMYRLCAGIENFFQLTPSCAYLGGLANKALLSLAPSVSCEPARDEKLEQPEKPVPGEGNSRHT